jgi:hypothetical protein
MKQWFAFSAAASLLMAPLVAVSPCLAAVPTQGGAAVGQWKPWNLASVDEISVPAPPADTSDKTKAELDELRMVQSLRSPILNAVAENWNGLNSVKRWTDAVIRLPLHPTRAGRISAYMHTAILDAVIVAYKAKYAYNRKTPTQLAPDVTRSVASVPDEPSYPSEHAAIAGAASAVLEALDPVGAKTYEAMAQEEAYSRMIAGTNYRSDIQAGLDLGHAVAATALARAQSDGSDAKFTGTIPTGPDKWVGTNPIEPLKGTWRPWLMTSGDQFRPGPPPAIDSSEFKAALAKVKDRATSVTGSEKALSDFWLVNGLYVPYFNTAYTLMDQPGAGGADHGAHCHRRGRLGHLLLGCQVSLLVHPPGAGRPDDPHSADDAELTVLQFRVLDAGLGPGRVDWLLLPAGTDTPAGDRAAGRGDAHLPGDPLPV